MNSARHELVIMVVEDHNFQRKALMHQIRGLGYGNLLEAQKNQKAIGTTLCPARSLEIHCTRKRAVNSNCATRPNASQKSNLATKTS